MTLVNVAEVNQKNPIIKIEPYHKSFIVHWLVGIRCNYSCSYCPDMWHSYTARDKSLAELQAAWCRIVEVNKSEFQKYEIVFSGGEITLNKDFLPFLKWLHSDYANVLTNLGFITNGTASLKQYSELLKYCKWITFSIHSEFIDEAKFFKKILSINELSKNTNCKIKVNIMDEPWHKDRINEYKKFLDSLNIDNYIHPIYDFKEGKTPIPIKLRQVDLNDYKFIQR